MKTYKELLSEAGGGKGVNVTDPLQTMMKAILNGTKIKTVITGMKDKPKNAIISSLNSIINGEEPRIKIKKKITNARKQELRKELEDV